MRHPYKVLIENPEGRGHMGVLYIDGNIVLRADFKRVMCGLYSLAQKRDQWWAAVNVVMNYLVSTGDKTISTLPERPSVLHEEFYSYSDRAQP
jgi:hypothetical protein